ncbi:kelch repeat-containing protein [Candidatus Kapabacteria bacterium]|nr:kelch repeat-containing protein [Candidatus Kapabacteria bacterium]
MIKLNLLLILFGTLLFSQEEEWIEMESLPASASVRHHPITFSLNGYGYLLGGSTPDGSMLADFYKYDPVTNEWTSLGNYPGPGRGFGYGVSYNGKAYVGMGIIQEGAQQGYGNDLWEFDPTTEQWTQLAPLDPLKGRYHPAFIAANGKIFTGAGAGLLNATTPSNLNDWWEYDIETNVWRELPNIPGPQRHHPFYFGIGNDAYVVCGHGSDFVTSSSTGNNVQIYNDVYKWDSETEQWETLNDFPGEGRVAGTQFSYNGKGYLLSGEGEDHQLLEEGEMWEFDPEFNEWTKLGAHAGNSRWAPGNFIIENQLYLTSGRSNFRGQADVYEKDLWMYELPELINSIENEDQLAIELYPNPSSDFISLKGLNSNTDIEILNPNGKVVFSGKYKNQINIKEFADGVYIINANINNKTISKSFVKTSN